MPSAARCVTKAVIHLDPGIYHGHKFTVLAKNNSAENIYIQSASLNGKPLNRAWLTHQELTAGGTLRLVMGPNPNPAWGSAPEDRPPATMPADFHYAPPPPPASDKPVAMFLPIRIICGNDDPAGDFLPDPNIYAGGQNHRDASIDLNVPNAAPAAVYQSERFGKDFAHCFSVPAAHLYHVRLHFAEIFDDGAGQRVENIQINERTVLSNLRRLQRRRRNEQGTGARF